MTEHTELMELLKPHFDREAEEALAWIREDKAHSITDAHDMSGEAFIYATYRGTLESTDTVAELMHTIYRIAYANGYKAALDPNNGKEDSEEE